MDILGRFRQAELPLIALHQALSETPKAALSGWKNHTTGYAISKWNQNYNVGFRIEKQYLVIDIDAKNEGHISWQKLCTEHPALSQLQYTVRTPSTCAQGTNHSHHIYLQFKDPVKTGVLNHSLKEYPGIDFLSYVTKRACYVVAPPSVVQGKQYELLIEPGKKLLQDCPDILLSILEKKVKPVAPTITKEAAEAVSVDKNTYVAYVQNYKSIEQGERNDELYKMACAGRDRGCSEQFIYETLKQYAKFTPFEDPEELTKVVKSAVANAQNTPGCKAVKNLFPRTADPVTGEVVDWGEKLYRHPKTNELLHRYTRENTYLYLKYSLLKGDLRIRYNQFSREEEWRKLPPWREDENYKALLKGRKVTQNTSSIKVIDADYLFIEALLLKTPDKLATNGVPPVRDAITRISRENKYHPVREFCNQLPAWDGVPRIDTFFEQYCGSEHSEYYKHVARKMFAAIISRIFEPGCKFEYLVVLVGKQGLRKSTLCRVLAIRDEWFSDNLGDIKSKDAIQQLFGKVITEVPEMAAFRGMDIEDVKSYLSRQDDRGRLPYAHKPDDYPRAGIFIATHNRDDFLHDDTGNRRFWPVKIGEAPIKIDELQQKLPQIYAEAISLYKKNEPLFLPSKLEEVASEIRGAYMEQDDMVHAVVAALEKPYGKDNKPLRDKFFPAGDLWQALGRDVLFTTQRDKARLSKVLKQLGFESRPRRTKGVLLRVWGHKYTWAMGAKKR